LFSELGQALQLQSTVQVLVDPDSMSPTAVSVAVISSPHLYTHCIIVSIVTCTVLTLSAVAPL